MIDRDFIALQQVAGESVLWRVVCTIENTVQLSWADSRVASGMSRLAASIAATPIVVRIRVIAMTIAWAAAGYGASLFIAPPYVRSGVPLSAVLAVAAVALVVSISAEGLARSWAYSSLRANLKGSGQT